MKTVFLIFMVIPLALAPASRVSSLAARASGSSSSTPAAVHHEQPADALMHKRDFESGWRRAAANKAKLVVIRGRQGLGSWRGTTPATARCVPAATCRRRKVICVKRCYTARSRLARVPPATKCVIKCKKCVPTC